MTDKQIHPAVRILRREVPKWQTPIVTVVAQSSESPFHVLISCILSLRTQDATTAQASRRLFALANTPAEMLKLTARKIEKAIFPVGFYRTKAKNIRAICRALLEKYSGKVPDEIDELLKLKGVGRKTANLVVTLGYRKPGICVDTHVHRIANRLGWVRTRTPDETEHALYAAADRRWWPIINLYLVTWGQNVCRPVYPLCGSCAIADLCPRIGVAKVGKAAPAGSAAGRAR